MSRSSFDRKRFRRQVIAPRPPNGLVSIRYILPRLSPRQKLHRHLLATSMVDVARPVAALVNTWHWLRWVTFYGWRSSFRAVRARGPWIHERHGIAAWRQFATVLYLSLAHTVSAQDYYRLEFFRADRRRNMWAYVFNSETSAFHRWRNGTADVSAAAALLSDKHAFALTLAGAGLPTAETVALVPQGAIATALENVGDGTFICKPRAGSAAKGVVRVERRGDTLTTQTVGGRSIDSSRLSDYVERQSVSGEYLVQRYVESHPDLAKLGAGSEVAVTTRLITERHEGVALVVFAVLDVPLRYGHTRAWVPVNIDVETGRIDVVTAADTFVGRTAEHGRAADAVRTQADGLLVPHWSELVRTASAAHELAPELFGVAWDFIVGADGPVLLEGNSAWSMTILQQVRGPILATMELS